MAKKERLLNREISWLAFNERVLQEAEDSSVPLIERLRFLGIFSNNLDEFFRVRVATVKRMVGVKSFRKDSYKNPQLLLEELQKKVILQQQAFIKIYSNITKALQKSNVSIVDEMKLDASQKKFVTSYFQEYVRPALVPIMLKQVKIFPNLRDRSIYLAVKLFHSSEKKEKEFALLEVPTDTINRFISLPSARGKESIILLEDLIRFNLKSIFSSFGYDSALAYTVKLTRDAELDLDNDVSKSFIDKLYKSVKNRQKGVPVRLVYDQHIPSDLLHYLLQRLNLKNADNLIPGGRYHNFKDFIKFPDLGRKDLVYPTSKEIYHPLLSTSRSFFSVLKKNDILLQYPYHSFSHCIDFLREAAIDPSVVSIKITLYRVAKNSKVINALINAAKNGKDVTVVLELQARFDEEANIKWGRMLQEEGIQVLFGVEGLKVHSKLCLIERKENKKSVYYVNVSTGNYNEQTSHTYSDQALFTSNKHIAKDAQKIFDFISHPIKKPETELLVVSPFQTRDHFIKLINQEIKNKKKGLPSTIFLKMNSLVDKLVIEKLYEASKAGVECRLIIRGICQLRAGVTGLSENIQIISIIDRFLEHSRVYRFENAGKPLYYISSADFMTRNLDVRVEVSCPILEKSIQQQLESFLQLQWKDNVKARIIDDSLSNGKKISTASPLRSQVALKQLITNSQKTSVSRR